MDEVVTVGDRLFANLPYPRLFAALLTSHSFVAFEVQGIRVYSNIRGEEDNIERLLADQGLTRPLVEAGFLPFGRPATGNYDRICFDMRGTKNALDAPVVCMEHETVLSQNRIPRPEKLAAGLIELLVGPGSGPRWPDEKKPLC